MKKIESHSVPKLEKPERLSDYLVGKSEVITTRKGIKKAITRDLVKVNGNIGKTSDFVQGGELIELFKAKEKKIMHIDVEIPVLYEDDHLAVVHKPAGLIVSGNMKRTLVNALTSVLAKSAEKDSLSAPHTVHRLDKETSGVMLVGKTKKSLINLGEMFSERAISKTYHAITIGDMKKSGTIETPIKEKACKTSYKVLESLPSDKYGGLNLCLVKPETGRRHQIRIHLSELGNPILGDKQYGTEGKISKSGGLHLHASSLEFVHPVTEEKMKIVSPFPRKFRKLFGSLEQEI